MPRWLSVLCASLLVVLAGCSEETPPPETVQPVLVVQPAGTDAAWRRFPGEVRAQHESNLAFQVGGRVVERLVDTGAQVTKGQVLARLDNKDWALAVNSAQAQVNAAEADFTRAQLERDRYAKLLAKSFVSQSAFDSANNAFRAAQAQLKNARSQLDLQRNQQAYTELVAPADGVIAQRDVEVGQVVAAGQPVFLLAQKGAREVVIQLPEVGIDAYQLGQPARVAVWAYPDRTWSGELRELSPAANPLTRTFKAHISVEQGDELSLGQSAFVSLPQGPHPLTLPLTAVTAENEQAYVWRIKPDLTVERVNVRIGAYGDDSVPVLEGLAPNDWVVRAGTQLMSQGLRVRPVDERNRPVKLAAGQEPDHGL